MSDKRKKVVIVGAGFGGIRLARKLAKEEVDIVLIDRHNFHLFQPLLYQLSTSVLDTDEIAFPIRAFFRKNKNVDFFMAKAEGFDTETRQVLTNHGGVSYDYLVLAAGSVTNYFGMESVASHAYGMKTLQEALHIRNHVLHMFERAAKKEDSAAERCSMLTFVCVGGGPTGVEEAGAIAELINIMRKEYHHLDFSEVSVKLIEATDRILPSMPEELREAALRSLQSKGVEIRLETQVTGCDEKSLTLKDGTVIPTHTVIWAAGVRAVSLAARLGTESDRSGRILVEETLRVKGLSDVFAIGDNASFLQDGRPLATVAPVATQQADICACNIKRLLAGENNLRKFSYHDIGSMATIGRGAAVVAMGRLRLKGFAAWCAWMFLHLLRLEGSHTNITVVLKWTWNFISGTRLGRIITNIDLTEDD